MKVFYTCYNNGDGSSSVEFFDSQECINRLEEADPEGYGGGEGGGSFELSSGTIIKGLDILSSDYVDEHIEDFG